MVGNGPVVGRTRQKGSKPLNVGRQMDAGKTAMKPNGSKCSIGDEDELGPSSFVTTGFSIRTLLTRMRYFQAVSGGVTSPICLWSSGLRGSPQLNRKGCCSALI